MDLQETLKILEPPTQDATHGSAPGGEVEEEPNPDPNMYLCKMVSPEIWLLPGNAKCDYEMG